jgi:hypothetical protein
MVAPTIYRSDDASAPVLNGTAGALITVLDACLVNGYGSKPAAGWTKEFSGTHLAVYRMGTGGSARRMRIRVADSQAQRSNVRGFDNMTDANTGTEPFPTVAQFAGDSNNGMFVHKSNTADTTARPWVCLATPTFFYFLPQPNVTSIASMNTSGCALAFGEYVSYLSGFEHNVVIVAGANSSITVGASFGAIDNRTSPSTSIGAQFICRQRNNVAGAVLFAKEITSPWARNSGIGPMGITTGGPPFPDPVDGVGRCSRVRMLSLDSTWARIGHFPGLWVPHGQGYVGNHLDEIDGSNTLSGRRYLILRVNGAANASTNELGQLFFDTTDFD